MTAPFYFMPRLAASDLVAGELIRREPLAAAGIDDVLADVRRKDQAVIMDYAKTGPAGSGVLLYALPNHQRLPGHLGYYPEKQTWHRISDRLWIGFDNESPPTPEDVARRKLLSGYRFPLQAGGQSLDVPILRSTSGNASLPEDFTFDEAGELQRSIKSAYRQIWEDSAIIWDVAIDAKPGVQIDLPLGIRFCCRVLGLNYRFGTREQNFLKWVDSENWMQILSLCVDVPAAMEHAHLRSANRAEDGAGEQEKKTDFPAPDSAKHSPGSPDSDPTIDRAVANSGSTR